MVRTPEFKAWFGDWENDPENASKVVDENGEPLVCRHYSQKPIRFNEFTKQKPNDTRNFISFAKEGYYFSSTDKKSIEKIYNRSKKGLLYEVFLNVKNILDLKNYNAYDFITKKAVNWKEFTFEMLQKYVIKGRIGSFDDYTEYNENVNAFWMDEIDEKAKNQILKLGYKGVWGDKDKYADSISDEFYGTDQIVVFDSNQIKLADGTNTTFDPNNDDIRFKTGGTVLLAPNGNPSNLTTEQYKLVRTPEFKAWFGDWENDPENASKVVDENGEPLVCYHSSNKRFTKFDYELSYDGAIWFTENLQKLKDNEAGASGSGIIYQVFLNIRKIGDWDDYDEGISHLLNEGFNGAKMDDDYIVFESNQIKLADGTNTTFDPNNDDIRFKTGGTVLLAPNGNPSNLTTEQYELVRTPEFKRWFGDWENDPENASKVVDENGEPLVCFHGTNSNFTVFKTKKRLDSINNPLYESGLWFFAPSFDKQITEDERNYSYEKGNAEYMAETFMGNKDDKGNYIENKVIKVFLNVRNPKIIDGVTDRQAEELKYYSQEMRKLKNNDAIIMHGSLTDGNMFRDDINVLNANQIKLADGTNTTFDQNSDDIRFATGGTVLLAPNGKPSNLTTEQSKLVRTPEFKAWFGDWENDPKNASKVVDENGEPKVVWRGESKEFNKFDYKKLGSQLKTAWRKAGFYFSPTKVGAEQYMIFMRSDILKQFFLNIKNPNTLDSNEFYDVMDWGSLPKQRFKTNKSATDYANSQVEKMKIDNYDGFFVTDLETEDVYEIVAFNPNQIKLADGTNTTFDPNSDDIRYRRGGRTTAQTPAPSKERIYGSDRNKPRSSKDGSSAESIKYDNKTLTSIENKVEEHNEAHPDKKVNLATAKAVVRRGMGAYSKSHRPTISGGKPNSRVAWGLARLNAFLYKVVNGVSKSGKYSQDNDLLDELGIAHKKFAEGGNTEDDKITKAKQLLRNSFDYLEDDLELLGKGLNGMAFVTVIDGELYVAKYTKSLTEFWLSQMAMVSNPPHVVTIKDVKRLSDNFEYGIIHKYTDNGGVPNKAVWNVAIGIKFKEYLEAQKLVPPKEKEYVRNLAIKLSSEVQDYFGGITIDTSNDNWGYEDGKLVLFDIDGNVKKAQNEEWMQKYSSSKLKKGGKIPKKSKGGDCYLVTGRIALNNRLPNEKTREFVGEPYVIHAQVKGQGAIAGLKYGHAWVEDNEFVYDYSNGRDLKIPKEVYYRLGQVIEQQPIYFKYTFGEAKRKMAETGHFGSWDLITESGL